MKRSEPEQIGVIIKRVVDELGLTDTMDCQRACYLWPEVVGPGINRYTLRRRVEGSVLHVYISSAPLRNELTFMRSRIIASLNALIGRDVITDIIIH